MGPVSTEPTSTRHETLPTFGFLSVFAMTSKYSVRIVQYGQAQPAIDLQARAGKEGKALVLQAQSGMRFHLLETLSQVAPARLRMARKGADLLLTLPEGDPGAPDLVIKGYFDAVALHPYSPGINTVKSAIQRVRTVMNGHADAATPLWISEIAWGSAPPDQIGINKGPTGQAKLLRRAFKLILANRAAWKVEHLFWYHWRDPRVSQASCSFCASAGLLKFNRTAKPSMSACSRAGPASSAIVSLAIFDV